LRIEGNDLIRDIFKSFFDIINSNKSEISELATYYEDLDFDEAIDLMFIEFKNVPKTIRKLLEDKRDVYYGYFRDDSSPEEYFLCNSSIVIESEDIYFNAEDVYI
jgi:hypothetical protein